MSETSDRKKEHLELCLTDAVSFKEKTAGFENYEFLHYAATTVELKKITFNRELTGREINYPFLISCMTGGGSKTEGINSRLAIAANELRIPIGVGSQRQLLENDLFTESYKTVRKNAPGVPVFGNIGAAQICKTKDFDELKKLIDVIEGNALFVHLNPLQELIQKEGEPEFKYLIKKLEKLVRSIGVPVYVKEVGSGISKEAAKLFLQLGVEGIDVAGAGGTSWAGVEILRNKDDKGSQYWDWGLPTSYCIKSVAKLKKKYDFVLIGSGGINSSLEMAKAFALGADLTASARRVLIELDKNDIEGVINLVLNWFDELKKIMFLTGSNSIAELQRKKIVKKDKLF